MTSAANPTLLGALARLAELQREPVNRLALKEAVEAAQSQPGEARQQLLVVSKHLGAQPARWLGAPDAAHVPALVCDATGNWIVLVGRNAQGLWITQQWSPESKSWTEQSHAALEGVQLAQLRLLPPFSLGSSPVYALVSHEILAHRKLLLEASLGGLVIGLLGLITSFYSMQIYDRVIPTGAMQTLLVLSIGAAFAVFLDWLARRARMHLHEHLIRSKFWSSCMTMCIWMTGS